MSVATADGLLMDLIKKKDGNQKTMKYLDELINELQNMKLEYGNLPVFIASDGVDDLEYLAPVAIVGNVKEHQIRPDEIKDDFTELFVILA